MISELSEFADAIREAGIEPPAELYADGQLHRFHIVGDKPKSENGWYVFFPGNPAAGAFGCRKRGINEKWCSVGKQPLTPAKTAELKAKWTEIRRIREVEMDKRHAEARAKASEIFNAAQPASNDHPYLVKKNIGVGGDIKTVEGKLAIPLRDINGCLHGLQFIDSDGTKKFLPGTAKKGHYLGFGKTKDKSKEIVFLVEGYETAFSVFQAMGYPVAVAFDAGNLEPVALELRKKFPRATFIICADNDPSGVGQVKAEEAALAVDGIVAIPRFRDNHGNPTDFNDLHVREGLEAVRNQISSTLEKVQHQIQGASGQLVDNDEWPEPGSIEAELHPVPEFDAAVLLPDPIRDWIVDEADRMPSPVEFVAVSAIVALGGVIGTRCGILPKLLDTWIVIANLWGAIVGSPSAKKSPAISAGLRPLDLLANRQNIRLGEDQKRFEAYLVVQQAREDAIQARIRAAAKNSEKGNPEEIAQELLILKQNFAEIPKKRRYKSNDTTIEKLGELLQDNPVGMLILRDELTGLIAMMDKAGHEGDRAFYLEGWNGISSYDTDRIGRGSIQIPNLCLSVFGGIQPDKLLAYLEHASHALGNDGLMQRVQLLVYPDYCQWQWRDRAPDKIAQTKAFEIFEVLDDFDPVAWGASPADDRIKFPHFTFDENAQEIFKAWATELHGQKLPNESQPIVAQHLAKYDSMFPALALIFHLVDCASGTPRPTVSAESALRATAWCEFLEAHARRCYGLLVDDGLRAAQTLTMHICKGKLKDGFTARDVRRNQWRHLTTTEAVQSALEWLEDENHIRPEQVGSGARGGRPTTAYRINPALLTAEGKTK